jgi:hypothetical protein
MRGNGALRKSLIVLDGHDDGNLGNAESVCCLD